VIAFSGPQLSPTAFRKFAKHIGFPAKVGSRLGIKFRRVVGLDDPIHDPLGGFYSPIGRKQPQLPNGCVQGQNILGISDRGLLQSIDKGLRGQVYEFDKNAFTPNGLLSMSPGLILMMLRQPGRGQRSECSD